MKDAALDPYFKKRDFKITSEPQGGKASKGQLTFVIQKHAASRLHYDFRLELDGTLKSWAVPKGPSLDPADKRMAVHVEDHPIDYGGFEGTIPKGQYGAGQVIVWDNGTWEPVGDPRAGYRAGKLKFQLHGHKLSGGWTLVRMHGRAAERQEPWLLIKERDEEAKPASEYNVVEAEPASVLSGATIADKPAASPKEAAADAGDAAPKTRAAKKTAPTKASAKARGTSGAKAPASAPASEPAALDKRSPAKDEPAAGPTLPPGAKPAALPETFAPQLATLVTEAPSDAGWSYEIKFDGYRLLARIDGDDVRLFTRNGNDWSDRMPGLVRAVRSLNVGSGWLDGEIVVPGEHGAPDFNLLQNAFDSTRTESILYYVFDVPYYAGHDLRSVPLAERRGLLSKLIDSAPFDRIRFSEDFNSSPGELLNNACRMRLEGVIGKRVDSPYVSKRSPMWIKLKCTQRQEFVVGGWTDPKGSRTGIGSLLLGIHDEAGDLRFAGAVGSGFDQRSLATVKAAVTALDTDKTPFTNKPRDVKGHWVEPTLVAEVSFGEWTPDGRVRHAVFHGLRDDKAASTITREQPKATAKVEREAEAEAKGAARSAAKTAAKRATKTTAARTAAPAKTAAPAAPAAAKKRVGESANVEGIRISNPGRVVDASTGATKLDIVNYYLEAARLILPHLVKRPVSLVRAPAGLAGQLVFQRHAASLRIPELKELDPAISPERAAMVEVDSFTALIGSAQANVIEFHTWNATTKNTTRPDRMIFDLDPGEGVAWAQVREGTEITRSLLTELGLTSFVKTSGGKGLHVVVPITPKEDWETVKALSKKIVEHLAEVIPDRFVAKSGPKNRVGRIFVDYLRNGFGATTVCAWSLRARPGLGVSVPCAWDELKSVTAGDHWKIADVHERIEERVDPWADYAKTKQTLAKAMKALAFER
jgi:bifunctional non-homologous end joining protein LigD